MDSTASKSTKHSLLLSEAAIGTVDSRAAAHRGQFRLSPCAAASPLFPDNLDDLARRHERAQAHWRRRVRAFEAERNVSYNRQNRRLRKIGKSASCNGFSEQPAETKSFTPKKKRRRDFVPKGRKNASWRYRGVADFKDVPELFESDAAGQEKEAALRVTTKFGPYSRNQLECVWNTFDAAQAFGNRVDMRLLFRNPFLRDNSQYRRQMLDVLGSTNRRGPILLTRKEVLTILFPLLDNSEAKSFTTLVRLKEADERAAEEKAIGLEASGSCQEEYGIDPAKEKELRDLFALYDVDGSGFVDAKEILAALRGNYTAGQMAAGMGDAVTESEVAALMSDVSDAAQKDLDGSGSNGGGATREEGELDFHNFCMLFRDVF